MLGVVQAFSTSNVQATKAGGGGGHGNPLPSRPSTAAARVSRASSDAQATSSAAAASRVPSYFYAAVASSHIVSSLYLAKAFHLY